MDIERFKNKDFVDTIRQAIQNNKDTKNLSKLAKEELKLKKGIREKAGYVRGILAFDTTGSMGPYRDMIRKDLNYVVDALDKMLENYEVAIMGVGDHCDGPEYLQINDYARSVGDLKRQINGIKDTGGGDEPEAFECFFHRLNDGYPLSKDTSLILITDSVPHHMKGYKSDDGGCPSKIDYQKELESLKKKINGFYIISCAAKKEIKDLQKTMVENDKFMIEIGNITSLPNLVIGMWMSDVGRLDYMMRHME